MLVTSKKLCYWLFAVILRNIVQCNISYCTNFANTNHCRKNDYTSVTFFSSNAYSKDEMSISDILFIILCFHENIVSLRISRMCASNFTEKVWSMRSVKMKYLILYCKLVYFAYYCIHKLLWRCIMSYCYIMFRPKFLFRQFY